MNQYIVKTFNTNLTTITLIIILYRLETCDRLGGMWVETGDNKRH